MAGIQNDVNSFGTPFVQALPNIDMSQSILPPQAGLLQLQIDPTWPYYNQWLARSPIGASLTFTFTDLEGGIEENSAPSYSDTPVLGRPESYKTYLGTSNRQVSFVFQFRAQGRPLSGQVTEGIYEALDSEVTKPARWLDSLKYPYVDAQNISHAPPPCILTVGQLLLLRVVVTSCVVKWLPPWDPKTHLPFAADVACTFDAVHPMLGNYQYTGPTRFDGYQPSLSAPSISGGQGSGEGQFGGSLGKA